MLRINFPKYCDYQNASFILLTTQFTFQQIMKDRWINAGHEDDELKPFVEPELDISDQKRIGNYSVPACWCVCMCALFPSLICVHLRQGWASLVAQSVNSLPAVQETQV